MSEFRYCYCLDCGSPLIKEGYYEDEIPTEIDTKHMKRTGHNSFKWLEKSDDTPYGYINLIKRKGVDIKKVVEKIIGEKIE